jgi:hypothetical protein
VTTKKEAELERTTRLRGFRYGLHDFLAAVDLHGHCQLNAKLSRIGKILDSLLSQNGVFGDVKGREISFDRRIIH